MKVVFDTNVFIAAFLTDGLCAGLLVRARRKEFRLFVCPFILKEFKRILTGKLKISQQLMAESVHLIKEACEDVVQPSQQITGICRDEDDNNILACVLAAKADYLVTGDKGLLEVQQFQGITIISPRDFELLFIELIG